MSRYYRGLLAVALVLSLVVHPRPAGARARMVAVFNLRSTTSEEHQAHHLSVEIANAIAAQVGWDAKVIKQGTNSKGDAAAAIGAELYVSGQYTAGHATIASFRVATDEKITELTFSASGGELPKTTDVVSLLGTQSASDSAASAPSADATVSSEPPGELATMAPSEPPTPTPAPTPTPTPIPTLDIHAGDSISVVLLSNIDTRLAKEGDIFAIQTTADYVNAGSLILPKGSPGYGVITHVKHAGSFKSDAEIGFNVTRVVTPAGSDLLVQNAAPAADAEKSIIPNPPKSMLQVKQGNDILIKQGSVFHIATRENVAVQISLAGTAPAKIDSSLVTMH